MTDKDIVERTEYDWRAIAPESWDHDYRELWVTFAYTNDRLGPDFLEWIADRLVHVYGESPNVDFVLSLRERADRARSALARNEVKL